MKKDSFVLKRMHYDKKLDDPFLNLYEEGIFIRCFEYSAVFISEITGYRLFSNIDKKTGKIFLECAFPKNKESIIIKKLESKGYNIRKINKNIDIEETICTTRAGQNNKIEKDNDKLLKIKKTLIFFE